MARVPISFTGRVKGGPARGGLGRECRFYTDDTLAVPKTLFRRETGGGLQPVVIVPNAGIPRALAADRGAGDAFVTVAIGQTGSFNVGDLIPIWNAVQGTVYRVITVITPATGRLDLDSALGIAFTVANGTQVNATDMEGHVWGWADDATSTWMQVKELGSNRLLAPVKVAAAAPALVIGVQEEGVLVNSRPTLNFIGPNLTATDDGANNRVNVTDTAGPRAATYVVGSADATLTAELVLGTAVIMEGTFAARPAASLAGRLYNDTTNLVLWRDTGAAWTQVTAPTNADYVTFQSWSLLGGEKVLGTDVIMAGTNAARPAAATSGRIYVTTDAPITIQRDNGATWLAAGFQNPMTTAEDIIKGGASGAQARLAAGANDTVLTVIAGVLGYRYPVLTTLEASLGSDFTITPASTWVDIGVSVSCTAGTWLLLASITWNPGGQRQVQFRLTDGTSHETSQGNSKSAAGSAAEDKGLAMSGIVSPGSTTTWKIQAFSPNTDTVAKAQGSIGASGNIATRLVAVRIG